MSQLPPVGGTPPADAALLDSAADPTAPAATRRRRGRWLRIIAVILVVLALIASLAMAGLWFLARDLAGNVSTIDGFVADSPAESYEPVNFLIMGSDFRGGGNTIEGETDEIFGERSDTTLLVHISGDRKRALAVSIPRDTLLELPSCASESGRWRPTGKFNTAFFYGGAPCTVEAVQDLTGVPIHHAVVVDFLGFKRVVDAIGGVEVCLEEDVYDRDSGLDLPAGVSQVGGDQALAFVRARKALGDGSDLSRIDRQQQFLASAIRQTIDAELLLKPVTLYRMLEAVTDSLTVDKGLDDAKEMTAMAASLRSLRPSNITFVTMPWSYSSDGADVLINRVAANEIWQAIDEDRQWPPAPEPGAVPLTVAPAAIAVTVSNGNGLDNAATAAAEELAARGFAIAGLAMADTTSYPNSVVVYNPADAEAARTLQAAVPGAVLQADPAAAAGRLQLIVGADYSGAQAVDVPAGAGDNALPVTADKSICAA